MFFDGIFFTQFNALFAIAALPLLWLLFRLLPLKPRQIVFPAMVLFSRKKADAPSPRDIPRWLKILRTMMLLSFILFFAGPIYDQNRESIVTDPLLLVIDNSWAAAEGWGERMKAAERLLESSGSIFIKPISILTTAPEKNSGEPTLSENLTVEEAKIVLAGIEPQAWNSDYIKAGRLIKISLAGSLERWNVHWMSDGQGGTEQELLLEFLSGLGPTTLHDHPRLNAGVAISDVDYEDTALKVTMTRRIADIGQSLRVTAFSALSEAIVQEDVTLAAGQNTIELDLVVPQDVINDIARIELSPPQTTGAVWLMDEAVSEPYIGIWSAHKALQKQDYLNDVFYLRQAAELVGRTAIDDVEVLMKDDGLNFIVLPDTTKPSAEDYRALTQWVEKGGTLLRFAGENLASERRPQLLPVEIFGGQRSLGGAMSWGEPARLNGLSENSPLSVLDVVDDFTVNRQVLARPSLDLDARRWAWIEDQSPLITHKPQGEGHIILVHTSADTSWSDLVISPFFPSMMKTLALFSAGAVEIDVADVTVYPQSQLDGFGRLEDVGLLAKAVSSQSFADANFAPDRPPGLYSLSKTKQTPFDLNIGRLAYNLGQSDGFKDSLSKAREPDAYDTVRTIEASGFSNLAFYCLCFAILCFVIDFMASTVLVYGRRTLRLDAIKNKMSIVAVGLCVVMLGMPYVAKAQEVEGHKIDLAYIETGDPARDRISKQGLGNLGDVLRRRTTVEFNEVKSVDLTHDDISLYPLIYWPLTADQRAMSDIERDKVQRYIDQGGMILFDTRDAQFSETGATLGQDALQRVTSGLNIGALNPIPEDHVLRRSYYLIDVFPGLYDGQPLWVETVASTDYDGVPSVIIGAHDWTGAWARSNAFTSGVRTLDRNDREASLRFGVNLIMMSLTGSYKKDQVHVKYILERFDRD